MEELNDITLPDNLLDEIQHNIEHIIQTFDVPEENKAEVIKQINFMYSRTKYLSLTDALTRLPNRRSFDNTLDKEFSRVKRYKNKLTLAIFDIDYFKKVNDTFGHQCGDFILKEVANAALQTFRKSDTVFRIGGEEFVVLLTETDIHQSIIPLERFRKTVETLNPCYNRKEINITVSVGACELTDDINTEQDLVNEADKQLYTAKQAGRNKTFLKINRSL